MSPYGDILIFLFLHILIPVFENHNEEQFDETQSLSAGNGVGRSQGKWSYAVCKYEMVYHHRRHGVDGSARSILAILGLCGPYIFGKLTGRK